MTQNEFLAYFPQFSGFTPAVVLADAVSQANARFSDFGEDTDEARRLYVAHKLTLYAQTALPEGQAASMPALVTAGEKQSRIASKKVGEVAVTYAASSSMSASSALADLPETAYGLQLLSLLRLHSFTRYVP